MKTEFILRLQFSTQILKYSRIPLNWLLILRKSWYFGSSGKVQSLEGFYKGLQKILYLDCCGTSWPHFSYSIKFCSYIHLWYTDLCSFSIPSRNWKDYIKSRREFWCSWNSRWKTYLNGILTWLFVQPKCGSSNKELPVRA